MLHKCSLFSLYIIKRYKIKNPGKPCGFLGFRVSFAYRSFTCGTTCSAPSVKHVRCAPLRVAVEPVQLHGRDQLRESPCEPFSFTCSTSRLILPGARSCEPLLGKANFATTELTRCVPLRAAFRPVQPFGRTDAGANSCEYVLASSTWEVEPD